MIEQVRELFEVLIAPQFETIRGGIHALDTKVEGFRRELLSEVKRVEAEVRRVESVLSTDMVRLEEKLDTRLAAMDDKLDTRLAAMDNKLVAVRDMIDSQRREVARPYSGGRSSVPWQRKRH